MESVGCDTTEPCGPEEWSKLQQALAPDYRLKIFQFKVNTWRLQLEPLYKGWDHGKCLIILYNIGHYDTIRSMPGVTDTQYYFDYCEVGYRNIHTHRTIFPHRCSFCLADTLVPRTGLPSNVLNVMNFFLKRWSDTRIISNPKVPTLLPGCVISWTDASTAINGCRNYY
jgi:hypothetical protein